jgi:hypothetical protein
MARRIRVPGVVDVVLVAEPAEIRALDEEPRIDRNFLARGPLINRLIVGRFRQWFKIDGQPLPPLAPRGDAVRAERQAQLAAALDPANEAALGMTPSSVGLWPTFAVLGLTMPWRSRFRKSSVDCSILSIAPTAQVGTPPN